MSGNLRADPAKVAGDNTAMSPHAIIVSIDTAVISAISRWCATRETALRSDLGDTGYGPVWPDPPPIWIDAASLTT